MAAWGEFAITAAIVLGTGALTTLGLVVAARAEHRRTVRRRLFESVRPHSASDQSPWGDVVELHPEAKRRATEFVGGGTVKAARAHFRTQGLDRTHSEDAR